MRSLIRSLCSIACCLASAGFVVAEDKLPLPTPAEAKVPPAAQKVPAPVKPPVVAPAAVPVVPADPARIAKWITELNDEKFEVREAATLNLSQAGTAAIEPLKKSSEGNNLEVTSRAIRALRTLYVHPDEAVFGPAEAALNALAASSNRGVARRAAAAITQPVAIQQHRVLKKIESLGGIVTYQMTPNGIAKGQFGEPLIADIRLDESWKGGDAGLSNLRKLTYLSKLYVIEGSAITPAGIESLHAEHPNLLVERRGRALLGVEGSTAEEGCLIGGVAENGAAAKAGIKPNDLIVKYDGVDLKSFQELIEITKRKKAGDKIVVEVLRQDPNGAKVERVKLNVLLEGWRSTSTGAMRRRGE